MTKRKVLIGIITAAVLILGGAPPAGSEPQSVSIYVTNTNYSGAGLLSAAPSADFTVTKTADDGTTGTLRWAITQANDNRGPDTINFSIPTSDPNYESRNGWWRITINNTLGALPTLTDNGTTIDGHSPGNENVTGLEILIDGSNLGGTMSILTIESDYNNIQGLALANAPGAGINIVTNAFNNTITDSYIGTDPNGALDWGNATGIKISSGANHNTIDQCVISGNDEDGVLITGSNTDDNIVRRSIIGLNAAGTDKIPNNWDGVAIANGAQGIVIGGYSPGEGDHGNVISGNNQRGVYLTGEGTDSNHINFNYIGVNKSDGGTPDVGNLSHGIMLESGPEGNEFHDNVISGNNEHGVYLKGTSTRYNDIYGNIIGADKELKAVIPNYKHGVAVYDGSSLNEIGHYLIPWLGNVIVGSGWSGVAVVNSWENFINNNIIGTDGRFSPKNMGNKYHGIDIVNSRENEVIENHIAYNGTHLTSDWAGIEVEGTTAISNTISMNSIYDNTGGGIDLVSGGNNHLPAPTITAADCTKVEGSLSFVCPYCKVEIYSDGLNQGKYYEGTATMQIFLPSWSWSGTVRGPNVTATVTDHRAADTSDYQNTSEFSLPWIGACYSNYLPVTYKNH